MQSFDGGGGKGSAGGVPEGLIKAVQGELSSSLEKTKDQSVRKDLLQFKAAVLGAISSLEHHLQKYGQMDFDPEWKQKGMFLREENLTLKEENFYLKRKIWEEERNREIACRTGKKEKAVQTEFECQEIKWKETFAEAAKLLEKKTILIEGYFDRIEAEIRELRANEQNTNHLSVLLEKIKVYRGRSGEKLRSLKDRLSVRSGVDSIHNILAEGDSHSATLSRSRSKKRNVFDQRREPDIPIEDLLEKSYKQQLIDKRKKYLRNRDLHSKSVSFIDTDNRHRSSSLVKSSDNFLDDDVYDLKGKPIRNKLLGCQQHQGLENFIAQFKEEINHKDASGEEGEIQNSSSSYILMKLPEEVLSRTQPKPLTLGKSSTSKALNNPTKIHSCRNQRKSSNSLDRSDGKNTSRDNKDNNSVVKLDLDAIDESEKHKETDSQKERKNSRSHSNGQGRLAKVVISKSRSPSKNKKKVPVSLPTQNANLGGVGEQKPKSRGGSRDNKDKSLKVKEFAHKLPSIGTSKTSKVFIKKNSKTPLKTESKVVKNQSEGNILRSGKSNTTYANQATAKTLTTESKDKRKPLLKTTRFREGLIMSQLEDHELLSEATHTDKTYQNYSQGKPR